MPQMSPIWWMTMMMMFIFFMMICINFMYFNYNSKILMKKKINNKKMYWLW